MFSRFRGALENLQAEEKARQQRIGQTRRTSSPSNTTRGASATRNGMNKDQSKEKVKDPSEFEVDEAGGASGGPSRTGTPVGNNSGGGATDDRGRKNSGDKPIPTRSSSITKTKATMAAGSTTNSTDSTDKVTGSGANSSASQTSTNDLPADVKAKLRKLEKYEGKYPEILRMYKIAYARGQQIEPFEKALRDNTPCTSISDPASLIEYLNNISLRSDMANDEYKKKSREVEELKKDLKEIKERHKSSIDAKEGEIKILQKKLKDAEESNSSSTNFLQEPLSGLPLSRVQSPKIPLSPKPMPSPGSAGDIFSFEDEHGRLEEQVERHEAEIAKLRKELEEARLGQKVAEEAMQRDLENVENAQRELEGLKDTGVLKDQEITSLRSKNLEMSKNLEDQKKELDERGELLKKTEKEISGLEGQVNIFKEKITELEDELKKSKEGLEKSKEGNEEHAALNKEVESLKAEKGTLNERIKTLERQLEKARRTADSASRDLYETKSSLEKRARELEDKLTESLEKISDLQSKAAAVASNVTPTTAPASTDEARPQTPSQTPGSISKAAKKRNKKKKGKGGPGGSGEAGASGEAEDETPVKTTENIEEQDKEKEAQASESANLESSSAAVVQELKSQLASLRGQLDDKDEQLTRLRSRMTEIDDLKEEIETLQESLSDVGQINVVAREQVKAVNIKYKELEGKLDTMSLALEEKAKALDEKAKELSKSLEEVSQLKESQNSTSEEHKAAIAELNQELSTKNEELKKLQSECDALKHKISGIESDLSASQSLAAARFKDLSDLKDVLSKKDPELNHLKIENANLTVAKNEANQKLVEMKKLERAERDLRQEVSTLKTKVSEGQAEIEKLKTQIKTETGKRTKAEELSRNLQKDLRKAEDEQKDAIEIVERTSRDLSRAQEEIASLRQKSGNLERELTRLRSEKDGLSEDLQLKIAQVASSQNLLSSMQDQASEIAMQMKETKDKCESLEEELAETHRLLTQRSGEAETMRRLLNDVESRNDAKFRDMKEKMEAAFEERDKAEESAATIGRSKSKDIEDLKLRVREAERGLKRAEEAKEITERERTEYQTEKEKAESALERLRSELAETKKAMEQMRDSLDETERQIQAVENQRMQARKDADESRQRYEKLVKTHKSLQDEIRTQSLRGRPAAISTPVRNSMESTRSTSTRVTSPAPATPGSGFQSSMISLTGNTPSVPHNVNADYLKNVMLQFLGQDKKMQLQLIPVLSQLLQFNNDDVKKWQQAVNSK